MEGRAARQVGALDEDGVVPAELRQPVEDRAAAHPAADHDHASAVTHGANLSYDRPVSSDLAFALSLADLADEITMRYFRTRSLEVETKADLTPVSIADRGAEEALRAAILGERSGEAVVGEEFGEAGSGSARWILDPIDGTRALRPWHPAVGDAHRVRAGGSRRARRGVCPRARRALVGGARGWGVRKRRADSRFGGRRARAGVVLARRRAQLRKAWVRRGSADALRARLDGACVRGLLAAHARRGGPARVRSRSGRAICGISPRCR